MIRLTRYRDKKPVYVFPEAIISAEIVDDAIMINARSDRIFVTESPEEVTRKVLEWRLAMERYRVSYALAMQTEDSPSVSAEHAWSEKEMKKLAGLEEPT